MAQTLKGNKNSATEDELGLLHEMVARIFKRKLQHWLNLLDQGGDADLIIDMKQLNNVIKFIGDNGIGAADPAASTTNELGAEIAQIREIQEERLKLVSFEDEEDHYAQG